MPYHSLYHSLIYTNVEERQVKLLTLWRNCSILQGWYWNHCKLSWKPIYEYEFLEFVYPPGLLCMWCKLGSLPQTWYLLRRLVWKSRQELSASWSLNIRKIKLLKFWLYFLRSRRVTHNFFPSHFSGTLLSLKDIKRVVTTYCWKQNDSVCCHTHQRSRSLWELLC